MANTIQKLNRWLSEPEGEVFKDGKWRFWFPMLIGFGLLNALLTAMVFGSAGALQTYMGGIMLSIGVLLAWLCIGTLHYSDSRDAKLARGVSLLDSATLIFVIAHFAFLLWIQGHVWALQSREAEYKAAMTIYNEKAEKISSDNVRIAEETTKTAQETTKAERLRNDTAYQERKAAEAGGIRRPRAASKQTGQSPALATSPVELEKPEKPKESSTDFLTRWDLWVRLANFFELALAAITFIYIRNRSAKFNAQARGDDDNPFPRDLDLDGDVAEKRALTRRGDLTAKTTTHDDRIDDTRSDRKTTRGKNPPGLRELRECLKLIAFENPPGHFKADVRDDYVIIRSMASDRGDQHTVHSAKASLSVLDDALTMTPKDFS